MSRDQARDEAARAVRVAESLVESLREWLHQHPSDSVRDAYEYSRQTLGAVREAARKLNEEPA